MDLASRAGRAGCWRHGCLEMGSREVSTLVCCRSPVLRGYRGPLTPWKGAPSPRDISGFALGHRNPRRAVETACGTDF